MPGLLEADLASLGADSAGGEVVPLQWDHMSWLLPNTHHKAP